MAGDREIPELVMARILSYLPMKYAFRTRLLSKRWNMLRLWETLPYLNLGEEFWNPVTSSQEGDVNRMNERRNEILLGIVDAIILKRHQQKVCTEKLCLAIPEVPFSMPLKPEDVGKHPLNHMVERWVSLVAGCSLTEFVLISHVALTVYSPPSILMAKSLTVLSLSRVHLSIDLELPSLRKVRLYDVYTSHRHTIRNLLQGCPLLEDLLLDHCGDIQSLHVTGLPKLKVLGVDRMPGLWTLEIDAPELVDLSLCDITAYFNFRLQRCPLLKKLSLKGEFFSDQWLDYFVSQCLSLEKLAVSDFLDLPNLTGNELRNVKVSSDTLKTLEVASENLVEIEITAPALERFTLIARTVPTFLLNSPAIQQVEINFLSQNVNLEHGKLAKFFGCFNHLEILTLHLQYKDIIPKGKRGSLLSPLCGTKNLIFYVSGILKIPVDELVEYMLWLSPRAETLSIMQHQPKDTIQAFLKFVYDQKNDHEDQSYPCCKYLPIKC